jgi:DNA-binding CsgD family transcriptional regulator
MGIGRLRAEPWRVFRALSRSLPPAGLAVAEKDGSASLTPRERSVLPLIAAGQSDREIAAKLGISAKTASVHVANIKSKLGVATRVQAVLAARALIGRQRIPATDAERAVTCRRGTKCRRGIKDVGQDTR